jgi:hypothetical protein
MFKFSILKYSVYCIRSKLEEGKSTMICRLLKEFRHRGMAKERICNSVIILFLNTFPL